MRILSKLPFGSTALLASGLLLGCASAGPSQQLVAARSAYEQASRGPAARYAPDELLEARKLLKDAEGAEEGSVQEQQLAYLADRQARQAAARGAQFESERRLDEAKKEYVTLQEQGRVAAERGLSETQRKLTETQRAQQEAEARADKAIQSLEELGRVKEEANETVVTLSGEVLFKTGQSQLLPLAEQRLRLVAEALKQLQPSQTVVIEGHTDSVGSEESNMKLSKARAESVETFLVSEGVDETKLKAVGLGESDPIADNATPEGRANNRRVELVIKKATPAPVQ